MVELAQQQQDENKGGNAGGDENDSEQGNKALAAVSRFVIVDVQFGGALGGRRDLVRRGALVRGRALAGRRDLVRGGALAGQWERLCAGDQERVGDLPVQSAAAQVPRCSDQRGSAVGRVVHGFVLLARSITGRADGCTPMPSILTFPSPDPRIQGEGTHR